MVSFKFNPLTGQLDLVGASTGSSNVKLKWALESIKAFDKVVSLNYINENTCDQAIEEVVYASNDFPGVEMIKYVYWLDIGLDSRRIDKVEYQGPVFDGIGIRKQYNYDPNLNRLGFFYEVF